jgi:hypothetical protein
MLACKFSIVLFCQVRYFFLFKDFYFLFADFLKYARI